MIDAASFQQVAEGTGALLAGLAVVAAGVIFLWKREWRTRLQMHVGIDAFCKLGNALLIEPVCIVENKGLLCCYVYKLDLSVRYLGRDDPLVKGDEKLLNALVFPHSAVKVQIVKPEWVWSYVEAGIRIRYSHVTHVPANTVAILCVGQAVPHEEQRRRFLHGTESLSDRRRHAGHG